MEILILVSAIMFGFTLTVSFFAIILDGDYNTAIRSGTISLSLAVFNILILSLMFSRPTLSETKYVETTRVTVRKYSNFYYLPWINNISESRELIERKPE